MIDLRAIVAEQRKTQGLPPTVSDGSALQVVAQLVGAGIAQRRRGERRRGGRSRVDAVRSSKA